MTLDQLLIGFPTQASSPEPILVCWCCLLTCWAWLNSYRIARLEKELRLTRQDLFDKMDCPITHTHSDN